MTPLASGVHWSKAVAHVDAPARPVVLIVDDTPDARDIYSLYLQHRGFTVLTARDGNEGVEMAREHRPALVLVDFMMPDADGGWLVRSLRAEGGRLAEVPVVLTTGSSAGREIAESLGVRALEKPFDMNRLLELVRTLAPTSS